MGYTVTLRILSSTSEKNEGTKKRIFSVLVPYCQEIAIDGQDKVFKDVIEPLESVSVTVFPTTKKEVKELGPPQEV